MTKTIVWSPLAENDFNQILDYLQKKWGSKTSLQFVLHVENLIAQISINPKQFPIIESTFGVRKCVITKHNNLYYVCSKGQIGILRIYDNRQNPINLKF